MGLLQDQNYISKQQPMPMSESDSSSVVVSITGETVQLYYSSTGTRTADAGQAAGTVVVGQLASSNILDASGGYIATNRDTSLSFTGTCFTTEIDFPYSQFKDSKDKTWASKLADVTAVMNNGEYCVDYGSGTIYGKKTTTASSLTSVAYKKKAESVTLATKLDSTNDSISTYPVAVSHAQVTAAAASLVAKASAGTVNEVRITNGAVAQYFQLHDVSSLPANGVPPKEVVYIAANGVGGWSWPQGRVCTTGITVCNSSTMATKTIGAADSWIAIDYV